jgi:hypothetical protein
MAQVGPSKTQMAAALERVNELAEGALDPELSREDLVRCVKDIADVAGGDDGDDEAEDDEEDDE